MDKNVETSRLNLFNKSYNQGLRDSDWSPTEGHKKYAAWEWFNKALDQIVAPVPPSLVMAYDPLGKWSGDFSELYKELVSSLGIKQEAV